MPTTAQMFDQVFKRAAARGVAVNVATGDRATTASARRSGAASSRRIRAFATGIGGTSINLPERQRPRRGSMGHQPDQLGQHIRPFHQPNIAGFLQGSGGGESVFLKKPRWQRKLPGTGRQLPDISALGGSADRRDRRRDRPGQRQRRHGASSAARAWPRRSSPRSGRWPTRPPASRWARPRRRSRRCADWAIRDVLPIKATRHTTSGSIAFRGGAPVAWTPAQLLGVDQTQPKGFLGALVYVGMTPFDGWNDVGFGIDSSLTAATGWDNATGYGVPNGVLFIASAALFVRH